jgi:Tat protein secretion system quality control protein TatD with DNase activity
MTLLIDSHVNLHHHAFADDREAVIARARAVGVGRMITICDKIENFGAVIAAKCLFFGICGILCHQKCRIGNQYLNTLDIM